MFQEIEHLLNRSIGRPSKQPKISYHSFSYQAKNWALSLRVVAKVVSSSRYVSFQLAGVAVPRDLLAAILYRIQRLRLAHEPD